MDFIGFINIEKTIIYPNLLKGKDVGEGWYKEKRSNIFGKTILNTSK